MRPLRVFGPALLTLALATGALAVTTATADAGPDRAPTPAPTVRLSVMTQNIFYGGDDYDLVTGGFCPVANGCPRALHRLAHVIAKSGADVVGVQEAEGNTRRLAGLLGWYASPQAHVISRFPIMDPPHSRGLFTYVEPTPGRVIAVANTHLPSTPYGPYQVRKGRTHRQVMDLERRLRVPALGHVLDRLPRLASRGVPVFLTGDFNSPSYLDWTPAVARARADVPYAVKWPASKALADAGFRDSYRDIHPDPVQDPGYTWSPGGPETHQHDFPDRIDWVLHDGPATTVASQLVGERGNPQVDIPITPPYPTDHRGVVSTFDVTPAPAPVMVAPRTRRVITGAHGLTVRFHAKGRSGEAIGLVRAGSAKPVRNVSTRARRDGTVHVRTQGLRPGRYRVLLHRGRGHGEASAPIWVYSPHSHARLRSLHRTYRVGQPITIHFTRAPGNNLDWVGLFRCHATCSGPGSYLIYRYTETAIEGTVRFARTPRHLGQGSMSVLRPGQYVARLLIDDGYDTIGRSPRFRITR